MKDQDTLARISQCVLEGDAESLQELAKGGLEMQIPPLDIITKAMTPALQEIGDRFGRGEAWLPQLVMAGNAMMAGMEILQPALAASGKRQDYVGSILLCTVEGDVHTIGKDIVLTLCRAHGFQVADLGVDVPSHVIVSKVAELKPDILGLSALMTTTMLKQREVIEMLGEADLREQVKVLVGGAPVSDAWAREIGADGYGADAVAAVDLCLRCLGARVSG